MTRSIPKGTIIFNILINLVITYFYIQYKYLLYKYNLSQSSSIYFYLKLSKNIWISNKNWFNCIEDLYPHVCLLESIEVIDKDNYSYQENKKLTLLDQIVLNGTIRSNIFSSCANICYFKDNKWEIINPIYTPFKRIAWLHINSDDLHILLKMIKEANISEIENLNLNQLDPRDLEESLDHENFNFKIQQLYYDEKDWELLSEVSLNNIWKIKPRQLHLSRLISMSHLIIILSNIPKDIVLNFQWSSSDEFSLKFSNTIAYFKDKKDILKIFWKLIWFKLNDRNKNEIIFCDKQNIAVSLCETMRI